MMMMMMMMMMRETRLTTDTFQSLKSPISHHFAMHRRISATTLLNSN